MKYVLSTLLVLALIPFSYGQVNLLTFQPTSQNTTPTIMMNRNFNARHTTAFYTNYKVSDLQVISVHQSNTPYDILFYVNEKGETQYKSMALSAPLNLQNNFQTRYDSFNPYGSREIGEAVLTGFLNTLFNKRSRSISFR